MTTPAAIGGGGAIGSGIGAIMQGQGQDFSLQAQAAANQYKSGVALLNKQVHEQDANWATQAGGAQAVISGMKSREQIARTLTTQAASGTDVNSGSNVTVRSSQTSVAQYDQNVIRWDAAKTSYGYQVKAATDQAESNLDLLAASTERQAGEMALETSYINAGSTVASKFAQGMTAGMFSLGS